jgi:hypothetical protein
MGRPARRPRVAPGPAPRRHTAKTAPGRCRRHPATATPPASGCVGPSRQAASSCRTRPGCTPPSARAQFPGPGAPAAEGAAQSQRVGHGTWWPPAHPAPARLLQGGWSWAAQPSLPHLGNRPGRSCAAQAPPIVMPTPADETTRRQFTCRPAAACIGWGTGRRRRQLPPRIHFRATPPTRPALASCGRRLNRKAAGTYEHPHCSPRCCNGGGSDQATAHRAAGSWRAVGSFSFSGSSLSWS